jgi:predicted nucleotidyltransferase
MQTGDMVASASTLPNKRLLDEITRRIVASVKPQRVLLFGSAARGRMSKNSDIDMLVVMREPIHRRQTAQKIYRNLHGTGIAVDIIVATEKDLERYGQREGTILKSALQEGRVLYEA